MKVWLDGELVDKSEAKISVFDHATLYGDGVFEGIRVYGGRIFQCDAHLDRLYASAERIRLAVPYSHKQLVEAMQSTIEANGISDGYIRLVVTRGEGTLGLNPRLCPKPCVFVIADQITLYPKEMYDNGMAVIIARTVRCSPRMLDPSVKSCNYLNNIYAKIEALDAGVIEAIMLNEDGYVAECTGDNLFFVRDRAIHTPAPQAGILEGITRQVVIDLAGELGIDVHERLIPVEELLAADECFLTGTAAEVIAVTRIDETTIGDGRPGPVTNRLLGAFHERIAAR
jgi:branched-chain amino acid aminotransferase